LVAFQIGLQVAQSESGEHNQICTRRSTKMQ